MLRPPATAAALHPLPRCRVTERELVEGPAQVRGGRAGDVAVRGAVEAVPADPQPVGQVAGQRVAPRARRHRGVEGGVEHRHLRGVRVAGAGDLDAGDVRGVVQRRERHQLADLLEHVVVDDGRPREAVAAVHHPVPHRERRLGQPAGALERREHPVQRHGVVGDLPRLGQRLGAGGAVNEPALVLADPLHQPGRAHPLARAVRQVEELVLQRRRPGVEHEDGDHAGSPFPAAARFCACTAVIATVLTMSGTSAPRDRSFTGLLSPCSTGPIATAPAERCTAL